MQSIKLPAKLEVLCYLGGLLAAFDLVDTGLSESDPVSYTLQLAAVLLYTVRHPGSNTHIHSNMIMDIQRKIFLTPYNTIEYRGVRNFRHPIPHFILYMHVAVP